MITRDGLKQKYSKLAAEFGELQFNIRAARKRQRELEAHMRELIAAIDATPDNVAVVPLAPPEES